MHRPQLFIFSFALALDLIITNASAGAIFQPGLEGDYLTITFCFCTPLPPSTSETLATLDTPPNDPDQLVSHYYQFDYWNTHLDETFTMNDNCTPTEDDKLNDCLPGC
ncbi:hypothetical protein MMC28_011781 [Mycoblastus sanguinarius]|nr:hypothetical protein [Mycoblastus sanguinarius]